MFSNTLNRSGCFNWLVTTPCFLLKFRGMKISRSKGMMPCCTSWCLGAIRSVAEFSVSSAGVFPQKTNHFFTQKKGGLVSDSEWKTSFSESMRISWTQILRFAIVCWCYDFWDDVNRLRGRSGDSFPQFSGGALALSRITWGWSLS